jgi:hypothetical protein
MENAPGGKSSGSNLASAEGSKEEQSNGQGMCFSFFKILLSVAKHILLAAAAGSSQCTPSSLTPGLGKSLLSASSQKISRPRPPSPSD